MLSRYRHEIDNARFHIASLWVVIVVLAGFLAWALDGWSQAPQHITFHVPPDLSTGATVAAQEVPKANVYAFSYYIWQQINRWQSDGAEDYPQNIYKHAAYMTPKFRADLLRDLERRGRRGEVAGRERALYELPGSGFAARRVERLGAGVWVVWLDAVIEETVAGIDVKVTRVRYPLRVIRYDVDREDNPWGLALDGFAPPGPEKLPDEAEETGL